ncbi:PadR family transcriptional regulator [Streptomyces spororaveus]|uniref:PadR family transcriptional regulator n=1 Tax=Streptomyces spororaveus TaxID=284039 RepID=UPI0036B5C7EF
MNTVSLHHALLGLLEDGPASGYDLTARFERSLQKYAWTARQSHVYPELKRLADSGLITVTEEGPRGRRTYAITDTGREELRDWLLSPPRPRAVRDERALRLTLLSALDIPQARELIRRHLEEADQHAAELRALADAADTETHPRGRLRFGRLAIEYGIHQCQAQQRWAHWALEQLDQAEAAGSTSPSGPERAPVGQEHQRG